MSHMTKWDTIKKQTTLQVLFKVSRILSHYGFVRMNEKYGFELRPAYTNLFPHIPLEGGIRLTELARLMGISKQAVFQLIDELEQRGVVHRTADPHDKRSKRIGYTDYGRETLLLGLKELKAMEAEIGELIGKDRMRQLNQTLNEIDQKYLDAL